MAHDLHQPSRVTCIGIGMDYDFLQPKHLEQVMCSGPLHLYTSVFRGGLIQQAMEPPKKEEKPVEERRIRRWCSKNPCRRSSRGGAAPGGGAVCGGGTLGVPGGGAA